MTRLDAANKIRRFAESARNCPLVALDTETTGLEDDARITDIGVVAVRDGKERAEYEQLIDPAIPIPCKVANLTGISDMTVAGKPSIGQVLPLLLTILRSKTLLGQNARFDLERINYAAAGLGLDPWNPPVIDTLTLARSLWPDASHHLTDICARLGVSPGHHHHALDDARATWGCYRIMAGGKRDAALQPSSPLERSRLGALGCCQNYTRAEHSPTRFQYGMHSGGWQ